MVALAAGPPATLTWPSWMTTTTGSGYPSSRRLPVAAVAKSAWSGALQPPQESPDLFTGDLDAEKMRKWRRHPRTASKEHNKGNCPRGLMILCSVGCTLTLPP